MKMRVTKGTGRAKRDNDCRDKWANPQERVRPVLIIRGHHTLGHNWSVSKHTFPLRKE